MEGCRWSRANEDVRKRKEREGYRWNRANNDGGRRKKGLWDSPAISKLLTRGEGVGGGRGGIVHSILEAIDSYIEDRNKQYQPLYSIIIYTTMQPLQGNVSKQVYGK